MENTCHRKKGIIIEGVECAGKSTLIQKLRSEVIPWDCKMLGHKSVNQFDRFISEYVNGSEVIFNRSHLSELVYSELFNRETPFSPEERKVLDEYIGRHYVVVLCEAETPILVERYKTRDYDQKVNENELNHIKEIFITQCSSVKVINYNGSSKEALSEIIPIIQLALKGE
jgi:thymidylate kinase